MPRVCRLGLATRGNTHPTPDDIWLSIERGINFLNWCGHKDAMSDVVSQLGCLRSNIVVATQLYARDGASIRAELEDALNRLGADYLDLCTFYYLETESEWKEICRRGGALEQLQRAREEGLIRAWGPTTHQRKLAVKTAESGLIDLLMIRYNAAHRGAEEEIFPLAVERKIPVIAYTCLRWGALIKPTRLDPEGFIPPRAKDCYRFALSHPAVSVALMAPSNRAELEEDLELLDEWRPLSQDEQRWLIQHGERVRKTAGAFP